MLRVVDHVLSAVAGVGEAQPPIDNGAVFDISEHRTSLAAPDAEIVIVALRHAQRISCVLISDDRIARRLIPNRTRTDIGTAESAACCGGRGRVAEWDDNACLPRLRRPPISGRDHQPRQFGVVLLPAEPAHGRGDCWLRAAPSSATRRCGSGRSSSAGHLPTGSGGGCPAAPDRGGSAVLDELRVTLSRAARRRQPYATADAGQSLQRRTGTFIEHRSNDGLDDSLSGGGRIAHVSPIRSFAE